MCITDIDCHKSYSEFLYICFLVDEDFPDRAEVVCDLARLLHLIQHRARQIYAYTQFCMLTDFYLDLDTSSVVSSQVA